MSYSILDLPPAAFSTHAPALVDLYIEAMGYEPSLRNRAIHSWRSAVMEAGFVAACALSGEELLGVTYGFIGRPEHWWYRQISQGIRRQHPGTHPTQAPAVWLRNYFELAEIHVHPRAQGQGIGRTLLQHILNQVHTPNILLSTPEVPKERSAAFNLYRSVGFEDVLRNFYFLGDPRPFAVLRAPSQLTA
ncbi:GNAT family N-acetyltransferase [Corynebacterium pseudopelargi]|uniref:Ribosomal-protein-alanine N-acetyltransferase n=1 Tax=Corynebacterium pseudopelargi TaxID=2080757 RepID=A0A3G6ITG4_9CORY|nr:GNAT family N-acetyltransferase [Corynebacterium pseudopelargi]AZA08916.1 ribosomal-protein-alanine N-acetyltransferase [Corynebacterium pseudopelargi]